MKDITIDELKENFDAVFDEINEGENFTITNDEGKPMVILILHEEFESLNKTTQDW